MSIEASNVVTIMKQALEALEDMHLSELQIEDLQSWNKAFKSLRQAIARAEHLEAEKQEQGEPVAWIFKPNLELLWPHEVERKNPLELNEYAPLYTHPQPAPVQEPVAYRSRLASGSYTYCNTPQFFDNAEPLFTTPPAAQPAYTTDDLDRAFSAGLVEGEKLAIETPAAQPKREWVGLTDEDIEVAIDSVEDNDFYDCVVPLSRAIEAKLKEKNT